MSEYEDFLPRKRPTKEKFHGFFLIQDIDEMFLWPILKMYISISFSLSFPQMFKATKV